MKNPDYMDQEIYQNGKVVAVLDGRAIAVEGIVNQATKLCGFDIDWYYVGGRAVVKTMGDLTKAKEALGNSIPRIMDI